MSAPAVTPSAADLVMSAGTRQRIHDGVPENTRRAYRGALARYSTWCAEHGRTAIPATSETVADYASHLADLGRTKATTQQALSAIRTAHRAAGHEPPSPERAKLVVRAAARERSRRGERAHQAPPVTRAVLRAMVETIDTTTIKGQRDHVALVLGFAMFARREELAGLHIEDLTEVDEGLEVWIRVAKTDKSGEGQTAEVKRGAHAGTDPATVVRRWLATLAKLGITDGPLLRRVDRNDHLLAGGITGETVTDIVRRLAVSAEVDHAEDYSAHSLRSGAATAAFMAGASVQAVCKAGRWADGSQAVMRYFRSVDRWRDHPLADVM